MKQHPDASAVAFFSALFIFQMTSTALAEADAPSCDKKTRAECWGVEKRTLLQCYDGYQDDEKDDNDLPIGTVLACKIKKVRCRWVHSEEGEDKDDEDPKGYCRAISLEDVNVMAYKGKPPSGAYDNSDRECLVTSISYGNSFGGSTPMDGYTDESRCFHDDYTWDWFADEEWVFWGWLAYGEIKGELGFGHSDDMAYGRDLGVVDRKSEECMDLAKAVHYYPECLREITNSL